MILAVRRGVRAGVSLGARRTPGINLKVIAGVECRQVATTVPSRGTSLRHENEIAYCLLSDRSAQMNAFALRR